MVEGRGRGLFERQHFLKTRAHPVRKSRDENRYRKGFIPELTYAAHDDRLYSQSGMDPGTKVETGQVIT